MTIFDRYLLSRFLHAFVILFVSTFGLFMVIDGFTNVDAFQQHSNGPLSILAKMAGYYTYRSSVFFEMVGPILAVISVMVVFATLHRHSEIHPLLAAGIPTYRLAVPSMIGIALVNAGLIANQELIIPRIAPHLQPGGRSGATAHGVEPVYDHSTHILIDGKQLLLSEHRLKHAEFLLPVSEIADELTTLTAREAVYLKRTADQPGGWLLRGVSPKLADIPLTPEGRKVVLARDNQDDVFVISDVSSDQLYNRSESCNYVSTPELIRRINSGSGPFFSIRAESLHLHERLMRPFINLLAVLVAVPLIVRKESTGLVTNLALCAGVLGLVYGTTQLFHYLGGANLVTAELAAWGPFILSGSLSAWLSGTLQT